MDISWLSVYFGMVGVLGWFWAFRHDLDREDGCLWKGWNGGIGGWFGRYMEKDVYILATTLSL